MATLRMTVSYAGRVEAQAQSANAGRKKTNRRMREVYVAGAGAVAWWRKMTRERFFKSAAALLLILTSEAILYRKVVRLWWMYDDSFQLRLVRDVGLGSLLSTKDFYGGASVFTPLLIVSLKADYILFGTAASFFYAHQLASFAIALLL